MATIVGKNKTTETLTGGADNDTLIGGAGTNNLIGGAGADIFKVSERSTSSGASRDVIADFQIGVDKIDVSAWGISSWSQLRQVFGDSEFAPAYFRSNYFGLHQTVQLTGIAAGDLSASDFIFSTSGARDLSGTFRGDVLFGSAADDILNGMGGADVIFGADGDDVLTGGEGSELYGGAGADTLVADTYGTADLWGDAGNDIFKVSARLDESYSDTLMRLFDFQAGQDKIDVSAFGVSAFDQLALIAEGKGSDIYFDAYYGDSQHIVDAAEGTFSTLKASDFIFDSSGAKKLIGTGWGDRLFGSAFNDTISGSGGDDQIFGGAGQDMISGGAGDNDLYGQSGDDTFKLDQFNYKSSTNVIRDFQVGVDKIDISIWGISSFDQLKRVMQAQGTDTRFWAEFGGADQIVKISKVLPGQFSSADFIFYNGGARTLDGTERNDTLFGGNGADTLIGDDGDDELYGGAGADVLMGGIDSNTLYGEAGADTFKLDQRILRYAPTTNVVADFQKGVDKIDVSAWGISSFAQMKLLLQTDEGGSRFRSLYGDAEYQVQISNLTVSKLVATDFIFYSGGARTQTGTESDDTLFGGREATL